MPQKRNTKIVATIGPASNSKEMIAELFEAGVNMFRLNFSHGTHDDHRAALDHIRALEKKTGRPIAVLADLQGPKLRIGTFKEGKIALKKNQTIRFDLDAKPGDETRVNLPHPEILKVLEKGSQIFLDDGKVRAEVTKKGKDYVEAVIKSGSALSDKKGLNVPGAVIPIPALTDKDKKDLKAALAMGVDWIAQSFVQKPEDAAEAKKMIGGKAALMVKLEKPSALKTLDKILEICDGVMLARGDLGVEIPPEDVPGVQKRVVRQVRNAGKPVVVATQMLESMIQNARPTRAEASDVATAVYDGADAVMLSAETASGQYPQKAVEFMDKICRRTETDETYLQMMAGAHPGTLGDPSDAITTAAYYTAQDVEAVCIVTYTMSGSTALRMSRQRPEIPVLCLTPKLEVARRMAVSYAVHAVHAPEIQGEFSGPVPHANRILRTEGIAKKGERFVMTAGVPFGTPGSTNLLRIAEVE
ncbi:MAG: pyruvate kinase [Alphaproteobacteria bacterium PRO2]|nr:pyruvate kinase [Alphaproteobacteria bacterium PRO2]